MMVEEVKSARAATEIAYSFISKYRNFVRPIKAVREGEVWLVDLDVGPLIAVIAKVKIDAKSGEILEYSIPS